MRETCHQHDLRYSTQYPVEIKPIQNPEWGRCFEGMTRLTQKRFVKIISRIKVNL